MIGGAKWWGFWLGTALGLAANLAPPKDLVAAVVPDVEVCASFELQEECSYGRTVWQCGKCAAAAIACAGAVSAANAANPISTPLIVIAVGVCGTAAFECGECAWEIHLCRDDFDFDMHPTIQALDAAFEVLEHLLSTLEEWVECQTGDCDEGGHQ